MDENEARVEKTKAGSNERALEESNRMPKTIRLAGSTAVGFAAVLASLAITAIAVGLIINARYKPVESGEEATVVDTWQNTLVVVSDGAASIIPLDVNDSRTLPEAVLWGDFENAPYRTELQYSNGRLYYEFATEEYTEPIRRALTSGRRVVFVLASVTGVPLVTIETSFAEAIRIVDGDGAEPDPVGVAFNGMVAVDKGTWDAIAQVRTQF